MADTILGALRAKKAAPSNLVDPVAPVIRAKPKAARTAPVVEVGQAKPARTVARAKAKKTDDDIPAGMMRSPLTKLLYRIPETDEEQAFIVDTDRRMAESQKNAREAAARRSAANTPTIGAAPAGMRTYGITDVDRIERDKRNKSASGLDLAGQILSGVDQSKGRTRGYDDYFGAINEARDRITTTGKKAGEELGGSFAASISPGLRDVGRRAGGFGGGHAAGLLAGGTVDIAEAAAQGAKYTDVGQPAFGKMTPEEQGRVINANANVLLAPLANTVGPAVSALGKFGRAFAGQIDPPAVMRTLTETGSTKAAAPTIVKNAAGVAGAARRRSATVAARDLLTKEERAEIHGSATDVLQRHIDTVHGADAERITVDPKAGAYARFAREELDRRAAGKPEKVTTNETAVDDFQGSIDELGGGGFADAIGLPPESPIVRLGSAMKELGWDEKRVNAATAAMNPIYEIASRKGMPLGQIIAAAADHVDPTGKLKQTFAAPFYSKLERVAAAKLPARASGIQMKNTLIAAGVKAEELDYTGVGRLLDEAGSAPVEKQALLDHLVDNQIRVEEVMKGDYSGIKRAEASEHAAMTDVDRLFSVRQLGERNESNLLLSEHADPSIVAHLEDLGDAELLSALRKYWDAQAETNSYRSGANEAQPTKFGQHTLPGGKNYRELLITLPNSEVPKQYTAGPFPGGGFVVYDETGHAASVMHRTLEEAERLADGYRAQGNTRPARSSFTQSHWDEKDVLAHVRFDERVGPNGEKVLHVAEIQSDWHQKGRRLGYNVPTPHRLPDGFEVRRITAADAEEFGMDDSDVGKWGMFDPDGEHFGNAPGTMTHQEAVASFADNAPEDVVEQLGGSMGSAIPDAPFKKTWHELAMKRIMRYAAENDFDVVSWDAGATQADRYDLSKQVQSVDVTYLPDGKYKLSARRFEGDGPLGLGIKTAEELPDVVGKELAEKIVNSRPNTGRYALERQSSGEFYVTDSHRSGQVEYAAFDEARAREFADGLNAKYGGHTQRSFTGLDLKVGGEGMKGFYDKMLPDFANKYGKKWGMSVESGSLGGDVISDAGAGLKVKLQEFGAGGIPWSEFPAPDGVHPVLWKASFESVVEDVMDDMIARPGHSFTRAVQESRPPKLNGQAAQVYNNALTALDDYAATHFEHQRDISWRELSDIRPSPIHQMRLTPEAKASILNDGHPLFQAGEDGVKGAYDPILRTIEFIKGRADFSTMIHENGHFFHQILAEDAEFGAVIKRVYGDITNVEGTERFARHLEDYFRTGKAPVKELQGVFDAIREWMHQIYVKWSGGSAPDEVRAIFDKIYSEPSPQTMRLVEEFDKVSLSDNLVQGKGGFSGALGIQDVFENVKESFSALDDNLAEAIQYRNARAHIMDRAKGAETDDALRFRPDDPRFDMSSPDYDEALTRHVFREAGGNVEDFDTGIVDPRPVITKHLDMLEDHRQRKFNKDPEFLQEMIDEINASNQGAGVKNPDALPDEKKRGLFRWVKRNRETGEIRVKSGRAARMVNISMLPRALQVEMVDAASSLSDFDYVTQLDWDRYMKKGEKPRIINGAEIATMEMWAGGDLADDIMREGVHGETVVPGAAYDAVLREYKNMLKYHKSGQREANPATVHRETLSSQPETMEPVKAPDATSGRQDDLQVDRIRYGLDLVGDDAPQGWAGLIKEAVPSRWPQLVQKKLWTNQDNADGVVALAEMKQKHAELVEKGRLALESGDREALRDAAGSQASLEKSIDELTEAIIRTGSEQARALQSRKLMLDHKYTTHTARTMIAMAEEEAGKKASKATRAYIERVAGEIEKADVALEKARAGRVIRRYQSEAGKRTRSVEAIGQDIKAAKEAWRQSRREANVGAFSSIIPGVTPAWLDGSVHETFKKLVKLEVEAGVARLDDLVTALKGHLADMGLTATDSEVRRVLAGIDKPESGPVSKKAAQGLLLDLRREAALIEQIEALERGDPLPAGRARPKAAGKTPGIEELETKLADMQERIRTTGEANREMELLSRKEGREARRAERMADRAEGVARNRAERAQVRADRAAQREAAAAERRAERPAQRDAARQSEIRAQIADIEEMLKSGEYFATRKVEAAQSAEVEKLLSDRDILRKKFDRAIDELGMSKAQKFGRGVVGLAQNIRGAQLGGDLGVLFRQGLFSNPISNPIAFGKGVKAAGKVIFSEQAAMTMERALNERVVVGKRAYKLEKAAGLDRTTSFGNVNEMEELVMARIIKKIPWVGERFGGSLERVQHAFINTVRAEIFDQAVRAGFTPEELMLRAKFINNATGRGNLDKVGPLAQAIFTSPRYEASRWSMLGEPFRAAGHLSADAVRGRLNKAALYNLRDLGTTAGAVYGVFKAAELAGYTVDWDPTSSDFLKMRRGEEVWDVTAGIAPRLRDAVRMIVLWGDPQFMKNLTTQAGGAGVRALSPGIKTPIEQGSLELQRRRGVAEPKSPFSGFETEEDERGWIAFGPLIVQSAIKSYKAGGVPVAAGAVAREALGTSVNRYAKPKAFLEKKEE